jgi:hypothetical protein
VQPTFPCIRILTARVGCSEVLARVVVEAMVGGEVKGGVVEAAHQAKKQNIRGCPAFTTVVQEGDGKR